MGSALEILHGHPMDFTGNILPQGVGHVVGNPCHHKTLDKGETCTDHVKAEHSQQNLDDFRKINAPSAADLCHQAVKQLCSGLS